MREAGLQSLSCSRALLWVKEKAQVRMVTLVEGCDPALLLLALGLHPLVRSGPGCGYPGAEARARATHPRCIHSGSSWDQPIPAQQAPVAGGSPRASCGISHPPPALPALLRCGAGSRGCVGGELLHCGSREVAKGLVLVPTAEIPTWPWPQRGDFGGPEQRAGATHEDQRQRSDRVPAAATALLQAPGTSSKGTSLG